MFKKSIVTLLVGALAALVSADKGKMTFYWIAVERDESGSGAKDTWLKTCKGENIKKVTRHFAERIRMEGTGALEDGTLYNVECRSKCQYNTNDFSCFVKVPTNFKWGIGNNDNDLKPYISVANNKIGHGKTVVIEQLKGLALPGATKTKNHNGCVRVDDECGSCEQNSHFDFFVGRKKYYSTLDNALKKYESGDKIAIDYSVQSCTLLGYGVPLP
jgi:hypothetical protein